MPLFKYRVGDKTGNVIEGEAEAENPELLKKRLEAEGRFIYEISGKGPSFPSLKQFLRKKRLRSTDFLIFNQELSALLKAGLPVVASLETLAEKEENPWFRETLDSLTKEVREGANLSDAMSNKSDIFTNLYVSSIRAGEKSGDLVTNILRYIGYIKRSEELKKKVVSASIYPLILLCVATGVVLFLLLYVVPSFSQIFIDSGTELPLPTLILISITNFMKDNLMVVGVVLIGLSLAFITLKESPRFKRLRARMIVSTPWLGDTVKKYAVAKFSRTLSTVLKSGSPLVSALTMAAGTLDNSYLEEKIISASKGVREGEPLAKALEESGLMPLTALKMILVGESSGSLEDMFENVAELFEDEVDRKINFITSTIEPLMMLGMGLIIALIVVAMYLPIFKIAGAP